MTIYKLSDNKWHVAVVNASDYKSECGMTLYPICERRKIGKGHDDCQEDPDKKHLCKECFKFVK